MYGFANSHIWAGSCPVAECRFLSGGPSRFLSGGGSRGLQAPEFCSSMSPAFRPGPYPPHPAQLWLDKFVDAECRILRAIAGLALRRIL